MDNKALEYEGTKSNLSGIFNSIEIKRRSHKNDNFEKNFPELLERLDDGSLFSGLIKFVVLENIPLEEFDKLLIENYSLDRDPINYFITAAKFRPELVENSKFYEEYSSKFPESKFIVKYVLNN